MTRTFNRSHYDAIIIGARCAGAATAMLLARQGAKVLIVDREKELHDTLSTHALMRPAVTLLDQWGLLDQIAVADTPVVTQTHFHYGPERICVPVKPIGAAKGLYAPRRWLLDRVLRDAAIEAGAELHTGIHLAGLLTNGGARVSGAALRTSDGSVETVTADVLIGADGRRSTVAESVSARYLARSDDSSATVYTYVSGLPNEGYRWYYGDKLAAGLIPTTDGLHCLFTSCAPGDFANRFRQDAFGGAMSILAEWEPEIAAALSASGPAERMRRFPGAPGHLRDCAGRGWALVGDAGYFKDPATAHGITDAFMDANRLAKALSAEPHNPTGYQVERDWIAPTIFDLTHKIASLDWDFDRLKALHMDLNACLKAEQHSLSATPMARAA